MIKKFTVLCVVIIAAYILLPFGFALWNENIGVRGQIIFAVPSASDEESTGEEPGESGEAVQEHAAADMAQSTEETQADVHEPSASPEPSLDDDNSAGCAEPSGSIETGAGSDSAEPSASDNTATDPDQGPESTAAEELAAPEQLQTQTVEAGKEELPAEVIAVETDAPPEAGPDPSVIE